VIDYLCGSIKSILENNVIIEVNNIGYSVFLPMSSIKNILKTEKIIKIYIVEVVSGMYNCGAVSFFGFLTKEERELYLLIKNEVHGIGAKKAIEYIDKISKSFNNFKKAIIEEDLNILINFFCFTKKNANKFISSLKHKIITNNVLDLNFIKENVEDNRYNTIIEEAIKGLISLGYKRYEVKTIVVKIYKTNKNIKLEDLIKKSLQEFY
jgi:Holliday junction DNA helicase RuvA